MESPFYWRREVELYASDLLETAPRTGRDCPRSSGTTARLRCGSRTSATRSRGRSTTSQTSPRGSPQCRAPSSQPQWLARGWLRRDLELRAERSPSRSGSGGMRPRADRRDPRVLVHNDFHPGTSSAPGRSRLIDWAFCGRVPGDDAGVLTADFLFDGFFPPDSVDHIWESYSAALAPELVAEAEFAYFAGNALRMPGHRR